MFYHLKSIDQYKKICQRVPNSSLALGPLKTLVSPAVQKGSGLLPPSGGVLRGTFWQEVVTGDLWGKLLVLLMKGLGWTIQNLDAALSLSS